jgi:RNA polymerase sigma-70 factor (ECF subfamily)
MTDGAFKVAVHRLRKRYRQIVKDRIAATVDGPDAVQEELDYLIQALTVG